MVLKYHTTKVRESWRVVNVGESICDTQLEREECEN